MQVCRGIIGFLATMSALGSAAALAGTATPPRPLGDPGSWTNTLDYPPDLRESRVQGSVEFVLTVDAGGRVSDCRVVQSSGSQLLDRTTCSLIAERARFDPARDGLGEPAMGTYAGRIYWVPPFDP